jgi:hypothetical protein
MFSSYRLDRRKSRPFGRVESLAEQEQLALFIVNQRIFVRGSTHRAQRTRIVTPLETRLLASIFGTLLSSQGSDALRVLIRWTRRRGNPSNLPACFMGVKSVTRSQSGRIRARLALGGRTHSSRLPGRLRTASRANPAGGGTVARATVRGVSARGTGLLRETLCASTPWCPFLPCGLTREH